MPRLIETFSLEYQALRAERERVMREMLGAGTGAIKSAIKALERRAEGTTRAAVPGRLWKAWGSKAYPGTGIAREPVGTLFLNGRDRTQGAIAFFTTPGRIKGKAGQYLAIPLPAAGSRGRIRDLTPGEWERRTGKRLRFVYRAGKPSLLVADVGTTNGRTGTFRPITRRRTAADQARGYYRGEQTVPIFVLIPFVDHANTFAIEPLVDASEGDLARDFFARIRAIK